MDHNHTIILSLTPWRSSKAVYAMSPHLESSHHHPFTGPGQNLYAKQNKTWDRSYSIVFAPDPEAPKRCKILNEKVRTRGRTVVGWAFHLGAAGRCVLILDPC
jgi:hypothetical protein